MTGFAVRPVLAMALMTTVVWLATFAPQSGYAAGPLGNPRVLIDSPIIEGVGTTFRFDYAGAAEPDWRVFKWSLSIISQDEWPPEYQFSYSRFNPSNPFEGVGTVSDELTPLTWNGRTNSGVVFPPGTYTVTFAMAAFINSQIHATDHSFEINIQPSTPTPTLAPTLTPTLVPTPTSTPAPDPAAAFNPVLLIHGLGGTPEQWQNAEVNNDYFSLLKSWGYPTNYIAAYRYAGVGVGRNGYNNQGDIPTMAGNMRQTVMQLRQASLSRGGDGKVDIVAFSMGGLIARQYVKDYPNNHYLDQVISIGTPYQGSWLMETNDNLGPIGFGISSGIALTLKPFGINIDPNQTAPKQMVPNSAILQQFNLIRPTNEVKYFTLYGDINTRFTVSLFNIALYSDPFEIGDGVVLGSSARTVSLMQSSKQIRFYDEQLRDFDIELDSHAGEFEYNTISNILDIFGSRYFHLNLTRQMEIQERVMSILKYAQ